MTATFISGSIIADKGNLQFRSLHPHEWFIEISALPGK